MARVSGSAWRAFAVATVLALACVAPAAALSPSLHQIDPTDPRAAGIIEILTSLGASSQDIADVLAHGQIDEVGDWFDPTTLQAAKAHAAGADLTTATVFEIHTDPTTATKWFSPGGPLAPGSAGVVWPIRPKGGAVERDFYVYATSVAGPPSSSPGFRGELGLAAYNLTPPGGGKPIQWVAGSQFPGDFFNNMNMAWSTRSENGGPFGLHALWYLNAGGGFVESQTNAVSVMNGTAIVTLIPESEAGGFKLARAFGFYGSLQPDHTTYAADTYPDITKAPLVVDKLPSITVGSGTGGTPAPVLTTTPGGTSPVPSSGPPATTTPGGSVTTGTTTSGVPWILVVAGGLILVVIGGWLFVYGRKPGGGVIAGGGVMVGGGGVALAGDPCAELLAAMAAAKAACDEATKAAAAADAKAKAAATEADAAKKAAEKARAAREAAEKELAKRQKPPEATTLGSTDYGGRHVEVSDYDLYLQAQARAEANAAHDAAVASATTEAGRVQAHDDWAEALKKVDGPDGLDEVRKRDKEFREKWIKEAEDALKKAREAEDAAKADGDRTAAAAKTAAQAASAAKAAAESACAAAAAAEKAALDAGCIGPAKSPTPPTPPAPGPGPTPPTPGGGTGGGATDGPEGPGGGTPPGGGGTKPDPTPPKPHGSQCPDGTEEWRTEGPSQTFLVPIPGQKIQASCEPGVAAFQEWLDGWSGFDADGKQSGETAAGIPPIAFSHSGLDAWIRMFGKIDKKAKHYEISFTLPLQEVAVHCERLYKCVNGYWVRQSASRAVESDPVPKPKSFTISAEAVTVNEVAKLAMQAVNAWKAAQQAQLDRDSFYLKCR